jgi:molybdopterin-guanine dinucleotide biosynthesis protein A
VAPRAITALILAGGAGRRSGGIDKGLVAIDGVRAVERCVAAMAPQVQRVWISANRHLEAYRDLGVPVLSDDAPPFQGPLAGIARALREINHDWLATVPVDAWPFPDHWVARLCAALPEHDARARVAHDGARRQALFALYPPNVARTLLAEFARGERAVWRVQDACGCIEVSFTDADVTFVNRNEC